VGTETAWSVEHSSDASAPRPIPDEIGIAEFPSSSAASKPAPGLTRRDFFADVIDQLRLLLPSDLTDFAHRATTNLVKVYFGNERIHYEVWTDGARGTIEIGLHFEDGPLSTAAYLAHFDQHIVELKHALGPRLELERWTTSWGHLYELVPLAKLTAATVDRTARRLAALITALQPLVEAADIAAERTVQPTEPRGPWRKWRRGRG